MSYGQRVKLLNVFNHLLLFYGIYLIVTAQISVNWLLIALIFYIILGILGANIGMHRYLSHRSFVVNSKIDKLLKLATIPICFGSPISWCALHRHHHKYSDTHKDIQNPKLIGPLQSWMTRYKKTTIDTRLVRDLIRDPDIQWIHKNYFKIIFSLYLILFIFHPLIPVFVLATPAALCFHGASAIGVIPHYSMFGYRRYESDDESVNSHLASLLSLGEGWHNNHHAHPERWRHGESWTEIDPSAWVIQMIRSKNESS